MTLEDDVRAAVAEALRSGAEGSAGDGSGSHGSGAQRSDAHGSGADGPGVAVESVTITPAGKRRVVRVAVDRPVDDPVGDSPIEPLTLDEIADATRLISDALDAGDLLGSQPYTLEVTTPGTDRPLTEPAHFRRNVGRLVTLTTTGGEVTGRVLATTAGTVELQVTGAKGATRQESVALAEITKGGVQVEFTRPGVAQDVAAGGDDDLVTDDSDAVEDVDGADETVEDEES